MTYNNCWIQLIDGVVSGECKLIHLKTNIIHFRKMSQNKTNVTFHIVEYDIELVSQYKYFGCVLTEHLDFSETAKVLADSAGRPLGVSNK